MRVLWEHKKEYYESIMRTLKKFYESIKRTQKLAFYWEHKHWYRAERFWEHKKEYCESYENSQKVIWQYYENTKTGTEPSLAWVQPRL